MVEGREEGKKLVVALAESRGEKDAIVESAAKAAFARNLHSRGKFKSP